MTDVQWIEAVRKYVLEFGAYNFSQAERRRMLPYLTGNNFIDFLHAHRFIEHMSANITMTFDLLDEMERGMANAVAAKLTQ